MSVFLIEFALETIRTEQKLLCPRWGSRHLLTHDRKRNSLVTFDDEFVMDVGDNVHATQRLYGIAENVAADGLRNVFHELRAVGFNPYPLFREIQSHVGNGFATELILSNARLHIGEPSAAR